MSSISSSSAQRGAPVAPPRAKQPSPPAAAGRRASPSTSTPRKSPGSGNNSGRKQTTTRTSSSTPPRVPPPAAVPGKVVVGNLRLSSSPSPSSSTAGNSNSSSAIGKRRPSPKIAASSPATLPRGKAPSPVAKSSAPTSVLSTNDDDNSNGNDQSGADPAIAERAVRDVELPHDPDVKKFRKLARGAKIYYSSFPRDCFEIESTRLGMSRTSAPEKADIIYVEHNPLTPQALRDIADDQRVNCWVGMKSLSTKTEFAMALNLSRSVCADSVYDGFPRTYILPQDRHLVAQLCGGTGIATTTGGRKRATPLSSMGSAAAQQQRQQQRKRVASSSSSTSGSSSDGDDDDDDRYETSSKFSSATTNTTSTAGCNTYIVKPSEGCGGDGIFLCQRRDLGSVLSKYNDCVVQEYVARPLLCGGYKWDIRLYVLLTSVLPLRFHIFKEGLGRFATELYEEQSAGSGSKKQRQSFAPLRKLNAHLTNFSLNKYSSSFKNNVNEDCDQDTSKRSLSTVFAQLAEEYGSEFSVDDIWDSISDLVHTTLGTLVPFLCLNLDAETTATPGACAPAPCFQIIGFDVLIGEDHKAHLLEINHHPSLISDAPIDMLIKGTLARSTLRAVLPLDLVKTNLARFRPKKKSSKTKKQQTAAAASASKNDEEDDEDEDDAETGGGDSSSSCPDVPSDGAAPAAAASSSTSSPCTGTACPLPASAAAAAAAASAENLTRKLYAEELKDCERFVPADLVDRADTLTQAQWERVAVGPLFMTHEPDVAQSILWRHVTQPLLRLRDLFVAHTGGAGSRNRSFDSMNGTRFVRFARRFGIVGPNKPTSDIDLLFLRYTRDKGQTALRFTDFVWLLLVELGDALCPNSAAHDKIRAVVDFLDSHDAGSVAASGGSGGGADASGGGAAALKAEEKRL